jgi:flagellin
MIINHNMSAMNAQRQFKVNAFKMDQNLTKLSSGERITKAGDDPSGLAVSEKMRGQIRGLNQASRNAQDGINFIQTTEGYLQETNDVLHRMRELSIQAANGVYTTEDRMQIQVEVSQLYDEVNRIASQAEFNTMRMLQGTQDKVGTTDNTTVIDPLTNYAGKADAYTGADQPSNPGQGFNLRLHVGANINQNENVFIKSMFTADLGLSLPTGGDQTFDAVQPNNQRVQPATGGTLNLTTQSTADAAIGVVDNALYIVNKQRADLGGYQNRLEGVVRSTDLASQNLQASESQIRDADMAKEMVSFVKNQILTQSASSMLAQGNQRSQLVQRVLG